MSNRIKKKYGDLADIVFKVIIKVPNGRIEKNVSTEIDIDYDLIQEQLSETPSLFAFWNSILADQRKSVAIIKRQILRRRSLLIRSYFDTADSSGSRISKWQADELVESDDKMLELKAKEIEEEFLLSKIWNVVDSLRMKSEHLRSLAGFKKQELRDSG